MPNAPEKTGPRPWWGRRRVALVAAAALALVMAVAWPRHRGPVYRGVGLDEWIDGGATNLPPLVPGNPEPILISEVLPALGTNAADHIVRRWARDNSIGGRLRFMFQRFVGIRRGGTPGGPDLARFMDTLGAARLVVACGRDASVRVAESIDGREAGRRELAAWVLRFAGDSIGDADRVRLSVRALRVPDSMVCGTGAGVIADIGPGAAGAVPALVEALAAPPGHPAADMPWYFAHALGRIGPAAKDALPALRGLLSSPEQRTRVYAGEAAWRIGADAGSVVPWLGTEIPALDLANKDPFGSATLVLDLVVAMGTNARPVAPLLGDLMRKAPDPGSREAVSKAWRAADPAGAGAGGAIR